MNFDVKFKYHIGQKVWIYLGSKKNTKPIPAKVYSRTFSYKEIGGSTVHDPSTLDEVEFSSYARTAQAADIYKYELVYLDEYGQWHWISRTEDNIGEDENFTRNDAASLRKKIAELEKKLKRLETEA